jgi:hypothetical protein
MIKLHHFLLSGLFTLIFSCTQPPTYISESGDYYSYSQLNELELIDSVKKSYIIDIIENKDKENEVLHFQNTNTFLFYKYRDTSLNKNQNWILGKIQFENKIREPLLSSKKIMIEPTYEPFLKAQTKINNDTMWSANHYGTLALNLRSPDYITPSKTAISGPSFRNRITIHWTLEDNKISGKSIGVSSYSRELKTLMEGREQVLVFYTKNF